MRVSLAVASTDRVWRAQQELEVLAREGAEQAPSAVMIASASARLRCCSSRHLLLHRVARDQPVGEHRPGLADAVRAVDGLRLHRRVPPRVEEEDVLGGREVQAEPAGLEADQEQPARRVVWKRLTARCPVARAHRRGIRRRCPSASSRVCTIARKLVNCEKTRALWPLLDQPRRAAATSASSLALAQPRALAVDQAGVARRLAQAQQRLEHLDLRSGQALARPRARAASGGSARAARRSSARCVALELAVRSSARAWRGSSGATCSLVRRRMNGRSARASRLARLAGSGYARHADLVLKPSSAAQHARVQELEQAPELAEVVLDRACRTGPAGARRAAGGPPWRTRSRRS